eukprot:3287728-Rhodomonas_salina.1
MLSITPSFELMRKMPSMRGTASGAARKTLDGCRWYSIWWRCACVQPRVHAWSADCVQRVCSVCAVLVSPLPAYASLHTVEAHAYAYRQTVQLLRVSA